MKPRLLIIAVLLSGSFTFAQQSNCKVNLANISGTYTGSCKNGLAHGKGKAQGVDSYEGQFIKGFPSGNGTYRWSNGSYYEGQWRNGLREGIGKMVYKDSVADGYWENDKYTGARVIPAYSITRSMGVTRSSIKKTISSVPGVNIRILQGGTENTTIEDFSLTYSSGEEYRSGYIYGVQNTIFPLNVRITYISWNQFHSTRFNVVFEITINDPGSWDLTLNN
jgi:hypothetical protein